MNKIKSLCLLSLLAVLSCHHLPDNNLTLYKRDFKDLPGFENSDELANSLNVFKRSCPSFQALNPEQTINYNSGKVRDWQNVCRKLEHIEIANSAIAKQFIEENFKAYQIVGFEDKSLFTGYYEPVIKASHRKYGKFQYPIYGRPDDLDLKPKYFTRKDIYNGILKGRNLELFYAADPVELYFLEVQGGGLLKLDSGQSVRIGYAGKNNREYRSIGAELLKMGEISSPVTADKIKLWLYKNPLRQHEVMAKNESFIFFKVNEAKGGPIGASGLALTPGYSIAIDNSHYAYGTPLWLATTLPDNCQLGRLMIAEDSGTAIKGPVRGDIFFGRGKKAEEFAGKMQSPGTFYILVPNKE